MTTAEVDMPFVLGPELAGTLMTPEEFDAVEECDERFVYELIHGVLIVTPPPLEAERGPNEELGYLLLTYRNQHPQGSALDDTLPEQHVRTVHSRRRADRVIWAGLGRRPDPENDPPSIAAEFISAGKRNRRRDYEEKRDEYMEIKVTEYWVIDRFRRIMTVYRNGLPDVVVTEQETYSTPLLPGFELPLARILGVADRWTKKKRKR